MRKGFFLHTAEDGRVPPFHYVAAGAITPKLGTALYINSGVLAVASGTNKPTYISMIDCASALTSGTFIPVIEVHPDMIFETSLSVDNAQAVGTAVTISSDGDQITNTTSSGKATIVEKDGGTAGDRALVKFL